MLWGKVHQLQLHSNSLARNCTKFSLEMEEEKQHFPPKNSFLSNKFTDAETEKEK